MAVTDQSAKKTKRKSLSKDETSNVNAKDSFSPKKILKKHTEESEIEDGFETDLDTPLFKKPVNAQPIQSRYTTQNRHSDSSDSETDMDRPSKQATSGKSVPLPKTMNNIHSQSVVNHSESDDDQCSVSLLQIHNAKISPRKKSSNPDINIQKLSKKQSVHSDGVMRNNISQRPVVPDMSSSESESEQEHNLPSEFHPQPTPTVNQHKPESKVKIQQRSKNQNHLQSPTSTEGQLQARTSTRSRSESESESETDIQRRLQNRYQSHPGPPGKSRAQTESKSETEHLQARTSTQGQQHRGTPALSKPQSESESETEIQPRLQNQSLSSNVGKQHTRIPAQSQRQSETGSESESDNEIQHNLSHQSLSVHLTQSRTRTESKSKTERVRPRTSTESQLQERNRTQSQSQSTSESESETEAQPRSQNQNQFQPQSTLHLHMEKETEQEVRVSSLKQEALSPPASIPEEDMSPARNRPAQSSATPVPNVSLFEQNHTPISAPSFDIPPDSKVWVLQVPRNVPAAHLLGQRIPSKLKGGEVLGPPETPLEIVEQPYDSTKNSLSCIFSTGTLCYGMRWIKPSAFWYLRHPPIKIQKETAKLHWGEETSPLPIEELLKIKTNQTIARGKHSKRNRDSITERDLSNSRIQNVTVEEITSKLQSSKKKKRKALYSNESDYLDCEPSLMVTNMDDLSSNEKDKKHKSPVDLTKKKGTEERKRKRSVDPDSDMSPAKKKKKRVQRDDGDRSMSGFNSPAEMVTIKQELIENEYDECPVHKLKPKDFSSRQEKKKKKKKKKIKIAQELVLAEKPDETTLMEEGTLKKKKKHKKQKETVHKSEEAFQEPEIENIEGQSDIADANIVENSVIKKKKKKKERK